MLNSSPHTPQTESLHKDTKWPVELFPEISTIYQKNPEHTAPLIKCLPLIKLTLIKEGNVTKEGLRDLWCNSLSVPLLHQ